MKTNISIDEICQIESNDDLHDYGGPHANKGNDFARFWLISELIKLKQQGVNDYVFLLEYVQDVARLDALENPSSIILYQLKKKDNSPWTPGTLSGLTNKRPNIDYKFPIPKLLCSVLAFKELDASAEFVSNARFSVKLASGQSSTALDYLNLNEISTEHKVSIKDGIAGLHAINPTEVPIDKITLRHVSIQIDDMRVHVIGLVYMFLKQISLEHAGQAESFVDALFVKLSSASRHTSKCATWDELLKKRGYGKNQFNKDLAALQALPDQHVQRVKLLEELGGKFEWHIRETIRIQVALNELLTLKLSNGDLQSYHFDENGLSAINKNATEYDWTVEREFEEVINFLQVELPEESQAKIRALSIYKMVEAWTNQTYA